MKNKLVIIICVFICILVLLVFIRLSSYVIQSSLRAHSTSIYELSSNSMEHNDSFDFWWARQSKEYERFGITKAQFRTFPFQNGLDKGDVILTSKINYSGVSIGDVVVLNLSGKFPWITRIINKFTENENRYLTAKGDYNPVSTIDELRISEDAVKSIVTKKI